MFFLLFYCAFKLSLNPAVFYNFFLRSSLPLLLQNKNENNSNDRIRENSSRRKFEFPGNLAQKLAAIPPCFFSVRGSEIAGAKERENIPLPRGQRELEFCKEKKYVYRTSIMVILMYIYLYTLACVFFQHVHRASRLHFLKTKLRSLIGDPRVFFFFFTPKLIRNA